MTPRSHSPRSIQLNARPHAFAVRTVAIGISAIEYAKALLLAAIYSLIFFAAAIPHTTLGATEYDIIQIGDPDHVNRDPVISETGLIAWYAHKKGLPTEGGGTHIYAYLNGQTVLVTDQDFHNYGANIRPQVFKNTIIWQTTRDSYDVAHKTTWILREVPDHLRDEGYDELPAFYANANLFMANQQPGNFNLDVEGQSYSGPYSNFWEYGSVYIQGEAQKTNTFEYLPKQGNTNLVSRLTTNKVELTGPFNVSTEDLEDDPYKIGNVAPYTTDVSIKARRRTITFNELCRWSADQRKIEWITHDQRNDLGPRFWDDIVTWQKAKSFPFGWEIMALVGEERFQLTTNFYYDMAPQVHDRDIAWYGWDGNDYEIFTWNADKKVVTQITSNSWDDVSPVIWDGMIAWEGYETVESEIFVWVPATAEKAAKLVKVSNNVDDDFNPVIYNGRVVWQGFDGDDFEVFLYDPSIDDQPVKKLTNNLFDDVNISFCDDTITWMGYHDNWDAEIFVWDWETESAQMITENDYEDKNPRTCGKKIVWQADNDERSELYIATPK